MATTSTTTATTVFFLVSLFHHITSQSYENPNPNPNPILISPPTAHAELNRYGFPIGLLPANVVHYDLNETSGEFYVKLRDACKLLLPPENYLAIYSKTVSGKIVAGRIAELDGIRVWAFFRWWSITGIRSTGDNLVFEVGVLSAKYPANNFKESLQCQGQHSAS